MMPRSRLRTITDAVLINALLEIRADYGYWDQDPAVYNRSSRKAHRALGDKMTKGVREVLRRVGEDGLEKHPLLKRVFNVTAPLDRKALHTDWQVFDALRPVPEKREPPPRYAF